MALGMTLEVVIKSQPSCAYRCTPTPEHPHAHTQSLSDAHIK